MKTMVLVVEDSLGIQRGYKRVLEPTHTVIQAFTEQAGYDLFAEHVEEIVAIIMDGLLTENGRDNDTLDLTRHIREQGFTGPIIATSSNEDIQSAQISAGCSHKAVKLDAVGELLRIL